MTHDMDIDRVTSPFQLLGFKQEKLHPKNYSKSYVDENGVLQNFEEGTLEKTIHGSTACA